MGTEQVPDTGGRHLSFVWTKEEENFLFLDKGVGSCKVPIWKDTHKNSIKLEKRWQLKGTLTMTEPSKMEVSGHSTQEGPQWMGQVRRGDALALHITSGQEEYKF